MEFKKGDILSFDSGRQFRIREIKEGGMGVVYICRIHKKYAHYDFVFKTFKDEIFEKNKNIYKSFINECKIWISLGRHPFIVETKSIETINNRPFVEMERVYSHNLQDAISGFNQQHLSPFKLDAKSILPAVRIGLEICLAMIYANRKIPGFVHRDLKPSNIMLGFGRPFFTYDIRDEISKNIFFSRFPKSAAVSDFGLAKIALEIQEDVDPSFPDGNDKILQFSKFGGICGTPPYMSPEQCRGSILDERSDIYAFGCIFYEMLTGRLLFQASTIKDFIYHHIQSLPTNIKSINPNVPDSIANIVMKCLHKNPDKRFSTFTEIYNSLHSILKLGEKIGKIYEDIFHNVLYISSDQGYAASEVYRLIESAYKLFQLGEDIEAKRDLEKAKNLYPARIGIYYFNLVRFCFPAMVTSQKDKKMLQKIKDYVDFKDEIQALNKVIEIDPEYAPSSWSPYSQLFDRYMRMDRKEEALNIVTKYRLVIDENDPQAYEKLRRYYCELGLKKEELEMLNKWQAIDKGNPFLYRLFGAYYEDEHEIEKAIEYYKIGDFLSDCSSRSYRYSRICGKQLADLYFKSGENGLAFNLLEKHKYYRELMELYWEKSNFDLAYGYFEKLLEHSSDHELFPYICFWEDKEYKKYEISKLISAINKPTQIRDFYRFYRYIHLAHVLGKRKDLNSSLRIYRNILEQYKAVPVLKRKSSKVSYFRRCLPLIIKILEKRINILESNLKDLKVVLLVINGPMKGHTFVLKGMEEILIGRDPGMNIFLPDDEWASRKHARILIQDDEFLVEDLNSTNGTYINGVKLGPAGIKLVKVGDSITVGKTTLTLKTSPQRT